MYHEATNLRKVMGWDGMVWYEKGGDEQVR